MTDAENTPTEPMPTAAAPAPATPPPTVNPPQPPDQPAPQPGPGRVHHLPSDAVALIVVGALLFGALAFALGWFGGTMSSRFHMRRAVMIGRGFNGYGGATRNGPGGYGHGYMMQPGQGQGYGYGYGYGHGGGGGFRGPHGWTPNGSSLPTAPVQ